MIIEAQDKFQVRDICIREFALRMREAPARIVNIQEWANKNVHASWSLDASIRFECIYASYEPEDIL